MAGANGCKYGALAFMPLKSANIPAFFPRYPPILLHQDVQGAGRWNVLEALAMKPILCDFMPAMKLLLNPCLRLAAH